MSTRMLSAGDFANSDRYRDEVHSFIPGGAHTYSKGDDQFPAMAPAAIARGKGGRVWDVDGNEYVDCSLALGAISLGHAYEPVLKAVRAQLELGAAFQRPAAIELELARDFLAAVPGADRIKFAKNGSTVTTAAVKLARAYTGRDLVAFPGNHSFYSYDDWFIGTTLCNNGTSLAVRELSLIYDSTQPETLEALFLRHPGKIACVITEPEEVIPRDPSALRQVAEIARRHGAVFVLDEMVSGFRAGWPGAHQRIGLTADLVTWGKAIGNGFSFCALTGSSEIMDLGGIKQAEAPKVFLISTTHGGEAHTLAAARAVLKEYQIKPVLARHAECVDTVARSFKASVAEAGLDELLLICDSHWRIVCVCKDLSGKASASMRTLLLQEMIRRGVLFQSLYLPCFSHTDEDLAHIGAAFHEACFTYRQALDEGPEKYLAGPAIPPIFRKYNGCRSICPTHPCPHEKTCRLGPLSTGTHRQTR